MLLATAAFCTGRSTEIEAATAARSFCSRWMLLKLACRLLASTTKMSVVTTTPSLSLSVPMTCNVASCTPLGSSEVSISNLHIIYCSLSSLYCKLGWKIGCNVALHAS